jgi:hypothetical protein
MSSYFNRYQNTFLSIMQGIVYWVRSTILLHVFMILLSISAKAQSTSYNQLCNEFQFARTLTDKWSFEVWFGSTFSSTDNEKSVLKTNIQRYVFAWGNYYLSPRWKLSSSLAYFYNKDVPDIGQYLSPEWRFTLQGIYFFHKTRYTLSTRMKAELRYIMNADSIFELKYRYRQMVKFMIPINSQVFRKGVFYFLSTEELFFKPDAKSTGVTFFDRNRFEIGGGYLITDNIQAELTYVNEFLPRDDGNQIYNCLALTFTFNNLLIDLKKTIFPKPSQDDPGE